MNKDNNRQIDFQLLLAKFKADIGPMTELIETSLIYYPIYAKASKAKYDSLIEVGFTKDEALKIVTEQGVMPK